MCRRYWKYDSTRGLILDRDIVKFKFKDHVASFGSVCVCVCVEGVVRECIV